MLYGISEINTGGKFDVSLKQLIHVNMGKWSCIHEMRHLY